jgi:hypothetical protein
MVQKLGQRIVTVVAFKLIILAFALSLTTLLVGIAGKDPEAAAILPVRLSVYFFKSIIPHH